MSVLTSWNEYKICNNIANKNVAKKEVTEYLNKGNAKEFFKARQ